MEREIKNAGTLGADCWREVMGDVGTIHEFILDRSEEVRGG